MCDCYDPRCEGCDERIPVHIGDCNYPREDVKVYCKDHMPTGHVTIFMLTEDDDFTEPKLKSGWLCGIRLQEGKIEPDSVDVGPNIGGAMITRIVK